MKANYDEMIREAFSEKIEVSEEYQQKIKETLKQARIASPQKEQYPVDIFSRTGSKTENFFQKHKPSVKTCLSLTACIFACLGFIIVLSVFLKQDSPGKYSNNTRYIRISATPKATEDTATVDNSLRTETPADTESPQKTNLPSDVTKPTLTVANTYIPENSDVPERETKNDAKVAQTKNSSKPGNSTTANHQKDATATPKRNKSTRSPELAQTQTQTSYTPDNAEIPQKTTVPTSIESPEKTKTPETNAPQLTSTPKASVTPSSATMFPTAAETPAETSVQASTMPTT